MGEDIAKIFSSDSPVGLFLQFIGEGLLKVFTTVLGVIKTITGFARIVVRMIANMESFSAAKASIAAEGIGKRISAAKEINKITEKLGKHSGKIGLKQVELLSQIRKQGELAGFSDKKIESIIAKRGLARFGKVDAPKDRPKNNFDFRGSRFDIQQNFAEGFDPDRIAVAFTNDLGGLGERRLSSGLAPAFAL